jgi:WD40 repeat protein
MDKIPTADVSVLWTPGWHRTLFEMIRDAQAEVLLVTPWLKISGAELVLNALIENNASPPPAARLLTSLEIEDFCGPVSASDLEAYMLLLAYGFEIRAVRGLHAKIYVCDSTRVIVTSGNLTSRGLGRAQRCNLEVAVHLRSVDCAQMLHSRLSQVWARAARLTSEGLAALASHLKELATSSPTDLSPTKSAAPSASQPETEPKRPGTLIHCPWWQAPSGVDLARPQSVVLEANELREALLADAYLRDALADLGTLPAKPRRFPTPTSEARREAPRLQPECPETSAPLSAREATSEGAASDAIAAPPESDVDADEQLAADFRTLVAEPLAESALRRKLEGITDESSRLLVQILHQLAPQAAMPLTQLALLSGLSVVADEARLSPLDVALAPLRGAGLIEELAGGALRLQPAVHRLVLAQPTDRPTSELRRACAANLVRGLRHVDDLAMHIHRRGVAEVLSDVLVAFDFAGTDNDALATELKMLIRLLRREARHLRRLPSLSSIRVFQQIYNRSVEMDLPSLALEARTRLQALGAPWISLEWRKTRESRQLAYTLTGHERPVVALILTPDGHNAVSASEGGAVIVWDLLRAQQVHTLVGHDAEVTDLAVTPEGQRVVSASQDGTLRVWDLKRGRAIYVLTGHRSSVLAVKVTRDGQRAVSASADLTLKVWDLTDGQELDTLAGHTAGVLAVAVTPDGRRAVSNSNDGTLKVWDLGRAAELRTIGTGRVFAMALTPDGGRVVVASLAGELRVWELASGHAIHTLATQDETSALVLTPDGHRAVSGSWDGTLKVWNLFSAELMHTISGQEDEVDVLAMAPDDRTVVSGSPDGSLRIWDLSEGRLVRTLLGHETAITRAAVAPSGQFVVSASRDRTLKVWDLTVSQESGCTGHKDAVVALAVTGDSARIVTASRDGMLMVWDTGTGEVLRACGHESTGIAALAVTADGKRAASFAENGALEMWDLASGDGKTIKELMPNVLSVGLVRKGHQVVSISRDGALDIWATTTAEHLETIAIHGGKLRILSDDREDSAPATAALKDLDGAGVPSGQDVLTAATFSPDGRFAFTASEGGTLTVWNLSGAQVRHTPAAHNSKVVAVALTPDARFGVSASKDGRVKAWDLARGQEVRTLSAHGPAVTVLALAADGSKAVAALQDQTLRLWDVDTGVELAVVAVDSVVQSLAMLPDGITLFAGDQSGTVSCFRLLP